MNKKTGVHELLDSLHDAVVEDLRLEGGDLVLDIRLVVEWLPDPEAAGLPEAPQAQAYRMVFRPYRLVFEGFEGPVPSLLKGHSLEFVEEKDGAYLLVTGSLEEYVLRATGLCLRAAPSAGEDNALKQEVTP